LRSVAARRHVHGQTAVNAVDAAAVGAPWQLRQFDTMEKCLMKISLIAAGFVGLMALGAAALAQQAMPEHDVSMARHPHISEAQKLAQRAFEEITIAQRDDHGEMGGHGQKAKALLEQVNAELKLAAEAADRH
jgi:hypothetical protein